LGNSKLKEEFFFGENTHKIAKELLGKVLVRIHQNGRVQAGIIVEDEAYHGFEDKASHASRSKTERNKVMFWPGGHYYLYFIYGMYWNLNIVTGKEEFPSAILIRALEPIFDSEIDLSKLTVKEKKIMTAGPGRLCRWLEIDKSFYGKSVENEELFLVELKDISGVIPAKAGNQVGKEAGFLALRPGLTKEIVTDKRVGVAYAEEATEWDWRYYIR
jgi:DNA-3-methyladenine glycosylase